jgi:hypothetical protein
MGDRSLQCLAARLDWCARAVKALVLLAVPSIRPSRIERRDGTAPVTVLRGPVMPDKPRRSLGRRWGRSRGSDGSAAGGRGGGPSRFS